MKSIVIKLFYITHNENYPGISNVFSGWQDMETQSFHTRLISIKHMTDSPSLDSKNTRDKNCFACKFLSLESPGIGF